MREDLDLILASAASSGVRPATGVLQRLLQACISTGLGNLGFMPLLIRLKRGAGQLSA